MQPVHNPLRSENIEAKMLVKDDGLVYMDELVYQNGSVYRGQLKPIDGQPESEEMLGVRHGYGV